MKRKFSEFNLSDDILKSLELLGFEEPTQVQEEAIEPILEGKDVLIKSQTGSGKTASFAIPLCELAVWEENKAQMLVLTPTRELAIQVKEDIFNVGRYKRLKVEAVYGKDSIIRQVKRLSEKTHIVVGTPGRVIDLHERKALDFRQIKYLVIDEADQMFNMGFIKQIETIINQMSKDIQLILLSATIPSEVKKIITRNMKNPVQVEIQDELIYSDRIEQIKYIINEKDKFKLLEDLIVVNNPDSCLIFCNTQDKVDMLENNLNRINIPVNKIHGGMEQDDRISVMNAFKKGKFRYLIATDVAARGIDVDSISLIVNYDLPLEKENYIHRIGRTGRKDDSGKALTLVTPYEKRFLNNIEDLLGSEIRVGKRPSEEDVKVSTNAFTKKMNFRPKLKEDKGVLLSEGIMKLKINAGKKKKVRKMDIVGTISSLEKIEASDIGIIEIGDIYTFVEILNNKGNYVLKELQTKPIKGKLRNVKKIEE